MLPNNQKAVEYFYCQYSGPQKIYLCLDLLSVFLCIHSSRGTYFLTAMKILNLCGVVMGKGLSAQAFPLKKKD